MFGAILLKIAAAPIYLADRLALQAETIMKYIELAAGNEVVILCFPEMALGYLADFKKDKAELIYRQEEIRRFSQDKNINVLYGTVEYGGGCIYNIQNVILSNGETASYKKIYLGSGEKKIFTAGDSIEVFKSPEGIPFSIALCYDLHFPEIVMYASLKGAIMFFAPHLMPGLIAKDRIALWQKYLGARAYDNRIGLLAVNALVGGKGGGAAYWNPEGEMLKSTSEQDSGLLVIDADLEKLKKYRENKSRGTSRRYFLRDRKRIREDI